MWAALSFPLGFDEVVHDLKGARRMPRTGVRRHDSSHFQVISWPN